MALSGRVQNFLRLLILIVKEEILRIGNHPSGVIPRLDRGIHGSTEPVMSLSKGSP